MPIKATIQRLLLKGDGTYIKCGNHRIATFISMAVMVKVLVGWQGQTVNDNTFAYVLVGTEPLGRDDQIEFTS